MIIILSGYANTGKDTAADMLADKLGFVKVALADPLKRIAQSVYGFTDEQLWGPSEERNKPDKRYPRKHTWIEGSWEKQCACCGVRFGTGRDAQCYLTPRYALQLLGTEWGRHCYENTWVDIALQVAEKLSRTYARNEVILGYNARIGLFPVGPHVSGHQEKSVVIPDGRHKNEFEAVKAAGGKVVRIRRKDQPKPIFAHTSETAQEEIPDEYFDHILLNISDLHHLRLRVESMMDVFNGRIIPYDEAMADVPPFLRK